MAHVAQMLTQELIYKSSSIFCFKPILLSAHKLILLIYGDHRCALHRVVALGVDWTSLVVKNLVELVLRLVALLTTRCAIHSADTVVRLTLTHRIPLVAGPSTVVVALPVVAAGKATAFLLLFICPALHHLT